MAHPEACFASAPPLPHPATSISARSEQIPGRTGSEATAAGFAARTFFLFSIVRARPRQSRQDTLACKNRHPRPGSVPRLAGSSAAFEDWDFGCATARVAVSLKLGRAPIGASQALTAAKRKRESGNAIVAAPMNNTRRYGFVGSNCIRHRLMGFYSVDSFMGFAISFDYGEQRCCVPHAWKDRVFGSIPQVGRGIEIAEAGPPPS